MDLLFKRETERKKETEKRERSRICVFYGNYRVNGGVEGSKAPYLQISISGEAFFFCNG